jgi:hypothetical protein
MANFVPNPKKVLAFIRFPKYSLYLRDRVSMWQDVKNGVSVFFTDCKERCVFAGFMRL